MYLHSGSYAIIDNGFAIRSRVKGNRQNHSSAVIQWNQFLLRGSPERPLTHYVAALVSLDCTRQNLSGARGTRRDQDVDWRAPHCFVRFRHEIFVRYGLPFERRDLAGRQKELCCRDRIRNVPARAITKVDDQLVNTLLIELRKLVVQFRHVYLIHGWNANVCHIVGDAIRHNVLRGNDLAIDRDFLRLRLPAPNHANFHIRAGRALQKHAGLPDRHIARTESANGFQNFSATQTGFFGRTVRHHGNHNDIAESL